MVKCIWCKQEDQIPSIEHIIPEVLGCPDGFVLEGSIVCQQCNNKLAHLDQAVAEDFDFITFFNGVPRKGGQPPQIRSRGNVIGTVDSGENSLSFNMEGYPVKAHDGSNLGKFGNSKRNIKANLTVDGQIGELCFEVKFGENPKFVRGILKIALSSVAFFLGYNHVLTDYYDPVRQFVQNGIGDRKILLLKSTNMEYRNEVWPPMQSESGDISITFRLAMVEFLVDLSPDLSLFPIMKSKSSLLLNNSEWTWLPIN